MATEPLELFQARQEAASLGERCILDTLRLIPACVGVTLRRDVGARSWEIALRAESLRVGRREPAVRRYFWEARELTDRAVLPDGSTAPFATPEAALADALDHLAGVA